MVGGGPDDCCVGHVLLCVCVFVFAGDDHPEPGDDRGPGVQRHVPPHQERSRAQRPGG